MGFGLSVFWFSFVPTACVSSHSCHSIFFLPKSPPNDTTKDIVWIALQTNSKTSVFCLGWNYYFVEAGGPSSWLKETSIVGNFIAIKRKLFWTYFGEFISWTEHSAQNTNETNICIYIYIYIYIKALYHKSTKSALVAMGDILVSDCLQNTRSGLWKITLLVLNQMFYLKITVQYHSKTCFNNVYLPARCQW